MTPAAAAPVAEEALVQRGRIAVPYSWSAGVAGTRFLKALREERRFLAARCADCRRLALPPTRRCGGCLGECVERVEVGPGGVLLSFARPAYASPVHPLPWPLFGLVRLDGADSALLVLMSGAEPGDLRRGMRVEPDFLEPPGRALHELVRFRAAGRP